MSYIHEALKKAQKKKDGRYQKYSGFFSVQGEKVRFFTGRAFWWTSLLIVLILLAFTSYSWFYSKGAKAPATTLEPEDGINAEVFYNRARIFHKTDRFQDARRFYQKALNLDPGYVDALNNLGVIYIHEKDYLAAQSSLEKAILLKPSYVDPYYNLSCLYALKGEVGESLTHLKKAVMLDRSVRDWARRDTDLKNLWELTEFKNITGAK
jgi:tetratricopeptide (TPR) repeat protein